MQKLYNTSDLSAENTFHRKLSNKQKWTGGTQNSIGFRKMISKGLSTKIAKAAGQKNSVAYKMFRNAWLSFNNGSSQKTWASTKRRGFRNILGISNYDRLQQVRNLGRSVLMKRKRYKLRERALNEKKAFGYKNDKRGAHEIQFNDARNFRLSKRVTTNQFASKVSKVEHRKSSELQNLFLESIGTVWDLERTKSSSDVLDLNSENQMVGSKETEWAKNVEPSAKETILNGKRVFNYAMNQSSAAFKRTISDTDLTSGTEELTRDSGVKEGALKEKESTLSDAFLDLSADDLKEEEFRPTAKTKVEGLQTSDFEQIESQSKAFAEKSSRRFNGMMKLENTNFYPGKTVFSETMEPEIQGHISLPDISSEAVMIREAQNLERLLFKGFDYSKMWPTKHIRRYLKKSSSSRCQTSLEKAMLKLRSIVGIDVLPSEITLQMKMPSKMMRHLQTEGEGLLNEQQKLEAAEEENRRFGKYLNAMEQKPSFQSKKYASVQDKFTKDIQDLENAVQLSKEELQTASLIDAELKAADAIVNREHLKLQSQFGGTFYDDSAARSFMVSEITKKRSRGLEAIRRSKALRLRSRKGTSRLTLMQAAKMIRKAKSQKKFNALHRKLHLTDRTDTTSLWKKDQHDFSSNLVGKVDIINKKAAKSLQQRREAVKNSLNLRFTKDFTSGFASYEQEGLRNVSKHDIGMVFRSATAKVGGLKRFSQLGFSVLTATYQSDLFQQSSM